MAMHVRADRLPFETKIDTTELYTAANYFRALSFRRSAEQSDRWSQRVCSRSGHSPARRDHNPLCYEIMTPESVGVPANELVLGKHSGRHALSLRYVELGYKVTPDELDMAYANLPIWQTARRRSTTRI